MEKQISFKIQNQKINFSEIENLSWVALVSKNTQSKYKADRDFLLGYKDKVKEVGISKINAGDILEIGIKGEWDDAFKRFNNEKSYYLILERTDSELTYFKTGSINSANSIRKQYLSALDSNATSNWKTVKIAEWMTSHDANPDQFSLVSGEVEECKCQLCGTNIKYAYKILRDTDGLSAIVGGECAIAQATKGSKNKLVETILKVNEIEASFRELKKREAA